MELNLNDILKQIESYRKARFWNGHKKESVSNITINKATYLTRQLKPLQSSTVLTVISGIQLSWINKGLFLEMSVCEKDIKIYNKYNGCKNHIMYNSTMPIANIEERLKRIEDFRNLKYDWNGYGAEPISNIIINKASYLTRQLNPPASNIFPTPNNSIQFEWLVEPLYLEMEIFENEIKIYNEYETYDNTHQIVIQSEDE